MTKAIRISRNGGTEVLDLVDHDPGQPRSGDVLIRQHAAGINLIDIYQRESASRQYAIELPAVLGVEGAGVVEAVGEGVTGFAPGDRVAYLMSLGGYAELRHVGADKLVKLPDAVGFHDAASLMVKGCTAQYLLHKVWTTRPGDAMVVHAAAGGVGSILTSWATKLGATMIGVVGHERKVQIAKDAGAAHVINTETQDFAAEVKALTNGRGVDVVFDSVGLETFERSMTCLRPLGTLVSFGQASGAVPPLDISLLAKRGSIFLTKPTLATFTADPYLQAEMCAGLFAAIADGTVKPNYTTVGLTAVPQVHRAIENRETVGAMVIDFYKR